MENILTDPDLSSVQAGNLKVILGLPSNKFISLSIPKNWVCGFLIRECGDLFASVIISGKKMHKLPYLLVLFPQPPPPHPPPPPAFCLLNGDGYSYFRRKVFLFFWCWLAHFTVCKKCVHVIYNLKMQTGFYSFVQLGTEVYQSPASFLSCLLFPCEYSSLLSHWSCPCIHSVFSHLGDFTHAASLPATFSSIFGPLLDHAMAPLVNAIIN